MAGNSTSFKPGQIGNPKGRPKKIHDLKTACQDLLPDILAALQLALTTRTERVQAANTLLAYGFGKPLARVEHRLIRDWSDLTDEELKALEATDDPEGEPEASDVS